MFQKLLLRWWPFHLLLLVLVTLMVVLSNRVAGLPALGPLLNPFTGFWQNTPYLLVDTTEVLDWPELKEKVTIEWDEHGVPHIFAGNSEDLFQVQGFVHARHRLFQMELTSRAGQGRLSEILGDGTLPTDLFFVRLGMRQAIENSHQKFMADAETREAMTAYSRGVNRYINSLNSRTLPVEYKILGSQPMKWSPKASASIFMVMTFRLAGRSYDLFLTRHAQKHGWEKIKVLFPQFLPDELITPYPKGESRLSTGNVEKGFDNPFLAKVSLDIADEYIQPFATNGSNNWAFSGSKSTDGHSWLANDTHLSYSLPAIFYEQQLITPEFNIYGASIIGSAGVQIGFHKTMGWAVTNGNTDVLDWYEVEFEEDYSDRYLYDGKWLELEKSTDRVISRSGQEVIVTHEWGKFGKIYSRDVKLGLAFRWMGHQTKNELKTFLTLTKARTHEDCLEAVKYYHAPIQNLICAGPKEISITHMGRAPKRTGYSGALVKDGRLSDPEWEDLISDKEMPQARKPRQGFVFSANQRVAPRNYKYYLSWDWEETYRASRIQRQLRDMKGTPDYKTFKALQTDIFSPHASEYLPLLLQTLVLKNLEPEQQRAVSELEVWDFRAVVDGWQMSVFHFWWEALEEEIYKGHLGPKAKNAYPKTRWTFQLIKNLMTGKNKIRPETYWYLGEGSDSEELKQAMKSRINDSFQKAWRRLSLEHGSDHTKWVWQETRPTEVNHILRLPAFSQQLVPKSGGRYSVDVNTGSAGAVWRQIVRIGEDFEAWTNFPGGPSGNPFSRLFDSQVQDWAEGKYRKVHFMEAPKNQEVNR